VYSPAFCRSGSFTFLRGMAWYGMLSSRWLITFSRARRLQSGGNVYRDDGSMEWDPTTLRGAPGSTLENAGSAFSSTLDWLTPTNATKQLACAEGINNLVGAVTGKIPPSPAGGADPVASKMLEDVWDQAKGGAVKPGEGVCSEIRVRRSDRKIRNARTNLAFLRWTPSCRPHYALRPHSPDATSL